MKILVFDIGGTAIKYGICEDGRLSDLLEMPTKAELGGPHIMDSVCSVIEGCTGYDAIGISTAGQVDYHEGAILYANSNIPNYTGTKLREELEERFHIPVMVENDVNCAAIGEAVFGAGREYQDFLCLTYGTGVGGAVIINRELYHGHTFCAGEFGGIVTHGSAKLTNDGDPYSGCYERYASTTTLVHAASAYDPFLQNGRLIFERLEVTQIREIVDDWIGEILLGLSTLIHIFNPPCVVLGGGIMAQPYITGEIHKRLPDFVLPSFTRVKVLPALLGNTAGLLGIYSLTVQLCRERTEGESHTCGTYH